MSGLFSISVQEARGFIAVPADLDRLAVVMGCSSAGSGLSAFYLSGSSAVSALGYGDAVDTLCQIIEQRGLSGSSKKYPAAFYTLPVTTPGAYGAINITGVTGTSLPVVDDTTDPRGTYEAGLRVITGGTLGTTGIKIQWTLDNGRTWSNTIGLGTATTYAIPNAATGFLLEPPDDSLVAAATEWRAGLLAHMANAVAHDGADTGAHQVALAASVIPTTNAEAWAVMNLCRAAHEAHRIITAGPVHNSADVTNIITAAVATTGQTGITLFINGKAMHNAHLADATAHNSADVTNTIAAATPARGTLIAGDELYVRTSAPEPSTADVDAAFAALATSSTDCALVVCDFEADAAMAAHFTTGLDLLLAQGKRCAVLCRSRLPDFEASETEATWMAAVAANYASFEDSRVSVRAGYALQTDAMTTRSYLRSTLGQFAADCVRVGRFGWPCAPADRAEPNVTMVDATGATLGHDEGPRGAATGLSDEGQGNRFSCEMRLPDPTRREDVFNTVPWVMYAADERIRNLMTRRLANAMERVAVAAGTPKAGGKVFYTSTGPSTGVLTASSRNAIQGSIYQAVSTEFASEIDNAADAAIDSGLVQVDPAVTVSGGNLLGISITLAPRVGGFVLSLSFTLAIQE